MKRREFITLLGGGGGRVAARGTRGAVAADEADRHTYVISRERR